VSTRRDLWLGLHQLRLTGELAEIRAADLRFTERETRELLEASGVTLSGAGAALLLLRTSLLDRVNSELAGLLTGRPGSERILLELEDSNAFVVSLDPGRTWFRFHRLFGDLLRLELRRTLPEQVPVLHRRAAAWFARHGHMVDAIRHTQAAGDWPDAARMLADHAFSLTLDGQARTVEVLVRAFPR
jgi:LuxR family maltose regulon positive regulatory protein